MTGGALALIPASGVSKALPRRDIRLLAGQPLVVHSIEAARASGLVDRVVVSTDDEEIAQVSRRHGAEVPFLRPPELAAEGTRELPVVQHALRWFDDEEAWRPEVIVQLRPTSPLRRSADIDRAVDLLTAHPDADSVRSVSVPSESPYAMGALTGDRWLTPLVPSVPPVAQDMPRQQLPEVVWQTGAIDAARWRTYMELGSMTGERILPLVVDAPGQVHIDTAMSLELAEWMIRSGHVPWFGRSAPPAGVVESRAFRRPKLLVFDFDGVFTDNRVWMTEHGEESVAFDRGDGMGLSLVRQAGVDLLVLSTEENPIVGARCRKLRIACRQGLADKRTALVEAAAERGLDLADVAYLGNDVNDLGCFEVAGLAVGVQDSHPDVLGSVDLVLSRKGGDGAVREMCDLVLSLGSAAEDARA